MKGHPILIVSGLVLVVAGWAAFGQQQDQRRQRWAQRGQAQLKAIETIQEQTGKLKAAMEESARGAEARGRWQDLSEEERAQLRQRWTKRREEWQKMVEVIEHELARLKGRRRLTAEYEEHANELREIYQLAVKEKANKTAEYVKQLIAKGQEEFEDTMQKLGFEQRP